jgi:hypothetical protein
MNDTAACKNTDREVWRGPDEGNGSYYADSVHITEGGGLGINCGGSVYVKPVREWHRLAGGPINGGIDPTSRGDMIADKVRAWYEANRESWWDRHDFLGLGHTPDRAGAHADNFILGLIQAVNRADKETPR